MSNSTRTKVRFGLVGYGSWAQRVHLPSIALADSAALAAICGPDADRAAALARQHGAAWSTNDPLRVATSDDIDAVLISSPNDAHAPVAIAAAQAGKHVLCEKPLARALPEALEMLRAARSAGIRHMTAFTWRNAPAASLAHQMVAAGEIGRVVHASAHFLHGGWLKLDDKRPWRYDRARMGSGILGDLGVHVFDLLAWMVGSPISRVCARLSTFGPKPDMAGQAPVFDDGHLLLEFANGARGSARISRVAISASRPPFPDMHQGVELYGETGALIYDLHRHSQIELRRPKTPAQMIDAPDPLPTSDDEWTVTHEMGRRQIERFARAILASAPAGPDFVDGARAQAVMDAAERSQADGGWADVHMEGI